MRAMFTVGGIIVVSAVVASMAFALWRPMLVVRLVLEFRVRRHGLSRSRIRTDGHRWPVFRSGTFEGRTVVVILHGFGVDGFSMLTLATSLARAGHSVLLPDLPGFGDHATTSPASLDGNTMLEALEALAAKVHADRVIVMGSSMGGALAAAWAHRCPNRVAAVVLLNPAGIEPPVANEVYTAPPGPGHPLDIRSVADFDRVLAMNFVNIPHIPWWLKRDLVRLAARHASTYSTIMQALEPLLRNGLADKLSHITQPVLLVWGKQDGVIDPSAAALWAQGLPCVDMMLLEGCGHVPWIDARMQTLAAVGNFVDLHVAST